jgi:cell division septation protein DedD
MTSRLAPRALLPVLSMLSCLALLAGCSRETDDWRAAQAADTVAAYQQFTREHPASSHAAEADARAAQLVEDEDWRRAQEQDTLQAYQLFLSQHPDSRWAAEARIRVETITLGSGTGGGPVVAAGADAPVQPAAPAPAPAPPPAATAGPHPPASPPARPAQRPADAPAAAPAASVYGVQLGAFTTEAAARSQWTAIAGRHAGALKGRSPRVVPVTAATGALFRLQTPTRDEAEARELCRVLAAAGQPCVVVHP